MGTLSPRPAACTAPCHVMDHQAPALSLIECTPAFLPGVAADQRGGLQ